MLPAAQGLEVELQHRGPRDSDKAGSVPKSRFAAAAAALPFQDINGKVKMVSMGNRDVKRVQHFSHNVLKRFFQRASSFFARRPWQCLVASLQLRTCRT